MGFHHEHTHGRAFHGLEARKIMEMERRDSHGSHIKLHVPKDDNKYRFIHVAGKAAKVETVVSRVYVTKSKTFSGSAVYVTETPSSAASTTPSSGEASYLSAKSKANDPNQGSTSVQTYTPQPTPSTSLQTDPPRFTRTTDPSTSDGTTIVGGTPISATRGATAVVGTPLTATHNSNPNVIANKSDSMSSAAKAGLAFGIIAAIALCAGLIFFCWRRRKNSGDNEGRERLDEKHNSKGSFFSGTSAAFGAPLRNAPNNNQNSRGLHSSSSAATAPRLSLRPVTQFFPSYIADANKSAGYNRDVPAMSEKPKSAWDRRPQNSEQNPFADAAVLDEKQARSVSPPSNPFDEGDGNAFTPGHSQNNSMAGADAPAQIGTAAAVPIAAAGASPRGPLNNVHRVQLDFKPSMDDELELRSGQLVRMLYEYDDGWTLCVRMDRSQQGVCPRTCLSKLPVKPRPQGPPPNGPNGRPTGPPPAGMRGPPAQPRNNMVPRPLTPTGRERSQTSGRSSPALQGGGRVRSQSLSTTDRPVSPLGAGIPARKPVPGLAF